MPPTPPSPRRVCRPPFFLALSIALSPLEASPSLLWYSPMNGNANAVVGSNGVPTGSPAAATDRDGNANSAVEFSGSSQSYDLGNFGTITAGSLSVWACSDSNSRERDAFCAGASGGGNSAGAACPYGSKPSPPL
jgi:hypothetical protein